MPRQARLFASSAGSGGARIPKEEKRNENRSDQRQQCGLLECHGGSMDATSVVSQWKKRPAKRFLA
jgi:hypothetical protein